MLKTAIVLFFTSFLSIAQVGIGTSSPNLDAMLDLESIDAGLLINTISLDNTTSFAPLTAHVEGIIIFNNATINDVTPGFYYNNGSAWLRILNYATGDWLTTGNGSTNNSINNIGTTNNRALSFRTNNVLNHALETNGTLSVFIPGNSTYIGEEAGLNSVNVAFPANATNLNTFVGRNAGKSNTIGRRSTVLGAYAHRRNLTGANNNAIGARALEKLRSSDHNVAIGYQSMENTDGDRNVSIGNYSLRNNLTGRRNTAVGISSLLANESGEENVAVGFDSMKSLVNSDISTAAGSNAYLTGDYENSTAIGYNTQVNADNVIHLGNTSVTQISGQVNYAAFSDGRIKKNIKEDVVGTDFIKNLRPVTYNLDIHKQNELMNVPKTPDYPSKYDIENIKFSGFIAQEIEAAAIESNYDFSGLLQPEKDEVLYKVTYSQFIIPLVQTLKEQQKRLLKAKEELQQLKNEL
ncbi:MAG: tail fiber domain-containing protein [Nonlabens sp.]|uniref:tail fiber domain-containing protein n=1 Tax=Nonlabens sp. TaxID=1888209 RepID=UPI003EF35B19